VEFGPEIVYHGAEFKSGETDMSLVQAADDYYRIEKALQFLENNFGRQPELKEIADAACLSEYHFQRLFSRWVGISPKRFLQFLTKEYAKQLLRESRNLLDATFDSGLSSPGRLHDLFVTCEAVTPGEFKSRGEGLVIRYGIHPSPFGECLLAKTERGICNLMFLTEGRASAVSWLQRQWNRATLQEDERGTASLVRQIFEPAANGKPLPLHLVLRGTNFQIKVWEALIQIPAGAVVSYEDLAGMLGKPGAVRAVANAVAHNPVSYIIPCHRVIRKMGLAHEYRWGSARKKAILGWEAARAMQSAK